MSNHNPHLTTRLLDLARLAAIEIFGVVTTTKVHHCPVSSRLYTKLVTRWWHVAYQGLTPFSYARATRECSQRSHLANFISPPDMACDIFAAVTVRAW